MTSIGLWSFCCDTRLQKTVDAALRFLLLRYMSLP